eukprot:4750978-Amphidinium_carterae.3
MNDMQRMDPLNQSSSTLDSAVFGALLLEFSPPVPLHGTLPTRFARPTRTDGSTSFAAQTYTSAMCQSLVSIVLC